MTNSESHENEMLDEVLAAYLEAVESGWAPDRQRLLKCYPHLADDLARFFATQDRVEAVTIPLRFATSGTSPSSTTTVPDTPPISQEPHWPRVPGYLILEELGRGGMGVVYKARQLSCDRVVALKMLLSGAQAGRQERERFRTEVQAVARLQHPSVVQLYEVGEAAGHPFFSMEYVPGGSLADHLDGIPLPPSQAARLVEALARAVHVAHEAGIVHRDLKPANVLLASEGVSRSRTRESSDAGSSELSRVRLRSSDAGSPNSHEFGYSSRPPLANLLPKITDFGLAKRMDVQGLTVTGVVMGTPSYMAPEQASQKKREVGPATDVYALGAILYECLTGRPPFQGPTPLDTLMQVVGDELVPPAILQPGCPKDLELICLRCLAKSPSRRYDTALALAEDLRRFLAGEPITARPTGTVERAARWARRHPATSAFLGLILLVLLTGFGTALWRLDVEANLRQTAEAKRDEAEQARSMENEARGRAHDALQAAEQNLYLTRLAQAEREWRDDNAARAKELLAQCPKGPRSWEWAYLHRYYHGSRLTLRGHLHDVLCVAFSPDGTVVASGSRAGEGPQGPPGEIRLWNARTGQPLRMLASAEGSVLSLTFSPDGKTLAAGTGLTWDRHRRASGPCQAKLWDTSSGRELGTFRGHTDWVSRVTFSPDGKRLATSSLDSTVRIWDVERQKEDLVCRRPDSSRDYLGLAFSPDGKRLAGSTGSWWNMRLLGPQQVVTVWDVATGQSVLAMQSDQNVSGLSFSPDGKQLAGAAQDGTVRLWDAASGKEGLLLRGHDAGFSQVVFSPDGKRVATAGMGRVIKVWEAGTGDELFALRGHRGEVNDLAFAPDGNEMASAAADRTVKIWEVRGSESRLLPMTRGNATEPFTDAVFDRQGRFLAASSLNDRLACVWETATGKMVFSHRGKGRFPPFNVALSPDGQRVACSVDQRTTLWEVPSGREVFGVEGGGCVAFSSDNRRLAVAARQGGIIHIRDAADGRELLTLKEHRASPTGAVFSPDGRLLVSTSGHLDRAGTTERAADLKLWELVRGRCLHEIVRPGGFSDPVFSADGRLLAAIEGRQQVRIWETSSLRERLTLSRKTGMFRSVCFTPDGRRLLTAGGVDLAEGDIQVWDVASGQEVLTLPAGSLVFSLAFSPDGHTLASAGIGGARLWESTPTPE